MHNSVDRSSRPSRRLNNDAERLERSANHIANPSGQLPNNFVGRSTLPPRRLNNDAERLERSANHIANFSGPSQLPNNGTERDNIVRDKKGKEQSV